MYDEIWDYIFIFYGQNYIILFRYKNSTALAIPTLFNLSLWFSKRKEFNVIK